MVSCKQEILSGNNLKQTEQFQLIIFSIQISVEKKNIYSHHIHSVDRKTIILEETLFKKKSKEPQCYMSSTTTRQKNC